MLHILYILGTDNGLPGCNYACYGLRINLPFCFQALNVRAALSATESAAQAKNFIFYKVTMQSFVRIFTFGPGSVEGLKFDGPFRIQRPYIITFFNYKNGLLTKQRWLKIKEDSIVQFNSRCDISSCQSIFHFSCFDNR